MRNKTGQAPEASDFVNWTGVAGSSSKALLDVNAGQLSEKEV
jgi:hypothetical protein